jgi:formate dehydrogenase subunit gamma
MTSRSHEPWSEELCAEVLDAHRGEEGSLLPILHDIQHRVGWVPPEATPLIAQALNLSRADVHGVVTFYHDFRHEPAGRTVVKLCQAEACQARGSRALAAHAEGRLGVAMGETSADGEVTLEPIYCLGLCASGPSGLIDDKLVARLDPARFDILVEGVAR